MLIYFAKRFARIFLRLHQLQIEGKIVTIATESVDFMDLTDTNPENNWYQFYTNYKWIGTKWKAYRLLVLSLDIDFVKYSARLLALSLEMDFVQ